MKQKQKYKMNEYVLLILVKFYTKRLFGLLIQREKAVKVTKRKALIGRACGATFLSRPGESKGHPV